MTSQRQTFTDTEAETKHHQKIEVLREAFATAQDNQDVFQAMAIQEQINKLHADFMGYPTPPPLTMRTKLVRTRK